MVAEMVNSEAEVDSEAAIADVVTSGDVAAVGEISEEEEEVVVSVEVVSFKHCLFLGIEDMIFVGFRGGRGGYNENRSVVQSISS